LSIAIRYVELALPPAKLGLVPVIVKFAPKARR